MQKTCNLKSIFNIDSFIVSIKVVTLIIFPISLFFSIRWSDYPVINLPFDIEDCFIKNETIDSSMLSLMTGYATGYIVFILTTWLPTIIRNRPMQKMAVQRLSVIYRKSIYLLLLMCKNTCTSEVWKKVIRSEDFACFNANYFDQMCIFDIKAEADTMLCDKEKNERITWNKYIEYVCNNIYKELDDVFLQYHLYLSNDIVDIITRLKLCHFMETFTGNNISSVLLSHDMKGYAYYDTFPIALFYLQEGEQSAVFSKNGDVDGSKILSEFIEILKDLYKILKKYPKGISVEKDYAISKLKQEMTGHYATAINNTVAVK